MVRRWATSLSGSCRDCPIETRRTSVWLDEYGHRWSLAVSNVDTRQRSIALCDIFWYGRTPLCWGTLHSLPPSFSQLDNICILERLNLIRRETRSVLATPSATYIQPTLQAFERTRIHPPFTAPFLLRPTLTLSSIPMVSCSATGSLPHTLANGREILRCRAVFRGSRFERDSLSLRSRSIPSRVPCEEGTVS